MRKNHTRQLALSGMLASAAVVIFLIGGIIPLSTYVCPVLSCLLCYVVYANCGAKFAWIWYGTVALLSLVMGPDKEASAVFFLLGYYPIVKERIDRSAVSLFWKILLFNCSLLILTGVLAFTIGLEIDITSMEILEICGVAVLVIMGNAVFYLVDRLLGLLIRKRNRR